MARALMRSGVGHETIRTPGRHLGQGQMRAPPSCAPGANGGRRVPRRPPGRVPDLLCWGLVEPTTAGEGTQKRTPSGCWTGR